MSQFVLTDVAVEVPWFILSNDAILIHSHLGFRPALSDKIIFSRDNDGILTRSS